MAILQHSASVIRHVYAEIFLVQAVPLGREILHFKLVMHHALFQLIAYHDVQRVCQLIGFGPYERRLDFVYAAVEIISSVPGHLFRKNALELREYHAAEGFAPAYDILVESALALMDAHRDTAVKGREGKLARRTRVIEGMTAFVYDAEH